MEVKGSQTKKNLLALFAGKSPARNRQTFSPTKPKRKVRTNIRYFPRDRK